MTKREAVSKPKELAGEKPEIGLSEQQREGVVAILNALLADECVLSIKTRNYHWNVVGPHFDELHKFFGAQYAALDGIADETAERGRALGGRAHGTFAEFLEHARLKEEPGRHLDGRRMLQSLLADHEAVIRTLRADVETCQGPLGDVGTADFLTGLLEQHEKMAWMLRAFLG